MSGFAGFFNKTQLRDKNQTIISQMAEKIAHRGPDGEGFYLDDDISLAYRHLNISRLKGDMQPFINEDKGKVLVCNGEVYNSPSLKKDLVDKGHVFATDDSLEVLLHAYEEYGPNFLNNIRGSFAFLIWDKQKKELFGARDIFGIKPMFYYKDGKDFMVASEIKAFTANPNFKKVLNRDRLPEYLCFEYIPFEETLFKNVYKLPAASYFILNKDGFEIKEYYDFDFNADYTKSLDDWQELIYKAFKESVDLQKEAAIEVGSFLSSGVDSSLVVWELAKEKTVKTFSAGFAEEKYSELSYVDKFAGLVDTKNFQTKITASEYFSIAKTAQYYMDEPLPNPSALGLYFLAKMTSKEVRLVLSGEGADELFGGYYFYIEPLDFKNYQKLPLFLRKTLAGLAKFLPDGVHGKRFLINGSKPIEERYIRNTYVFNFEECQDLLKDNKNITKPHMQTKRYFNRVKHLDDITKMQYLDLKTWLSYDILVKADRMSMANSLEVRMPFLDRQLLDIALSLPTEYRVTKDLTKKALRHAAKTQLPKENAMMMKRGFPIPLNDWLKEDKYYQIVKDKFNSPTAKEFFNTGYLMSLLNNHKYGKAKNMKKIWSIYSFLLWHEAYFE